MRYKVFATDYDGTLASAGRVAKETVAALMRLRQEGCKLILVTGRELPDLLQVFPAIDVFDVVVAENGALLLDPGNGMQKALAAPPPKLLLQRLSERAVPYSAGAVIVATTTQYERQVAEVLSELQLDHEVILNKKALMILPPGVHKGSGLQAALKEAGADWHETVGVGDAENDLHFLSRCGYAIATENALQMVRDAADAVTMDANGVGVREAIEIVRRLNVS